MTSDSVPRSAVDVKLDGLPLEIPSERRSLAGICSYLEALALQQERILCSVIVDGESINLTQLPGDPKPFAAIEEAVCLSAVKTLAHYSCHAAKIEVVRGLPPRLPKAKKRRVHRIS